jgi:hypothetical protein
MDEPDFKIKGLDSKNKNKGDSESKSEAPRSEVDNFVPNLELESGKLKDDDPDSIANSMQKKLDSDMMSSLDMDEKANYRMRYKGSDNAPKESKLSLNNLILTLAVFGIGYILVFENPFEENKVQSTKMEPAYVAPTKKLNLTGLSCTKAFSNSNGTYSLNYIPKGVKSMLKALDCMVLVGDFKGFDQVLASNPKIAKSEVVAIYAIFTRYLRQWRVAKPGAKTCTKWTMDRNCISKLLWYHKERNADLFSKYLKSISSRKYNSKSFFPSLVYTLKGMESSLRGKKTIWRKQLGEAVKSVPTYLRGMKNIISLFSFEMHSRYSLSHVDIAKSIRNIKSIGSGEFRDLQGIMTRLALATDSNKIVKSLQLKSTQVRKYPPLLEFWLKHASISGDYTKLDDTILESLKYVNSNMGSGRSVTNFILMMRVRSKIGQGRVNEALKALSSVKGNAEAHFLNAVLTFDFKKKTSWNKTYDYIKEAKKRGVDSWQFWAFKSTIEGVMGKSSEAKESYNVLTRRFSKTFYGEWARIANVAILISKNKIVTAHGRLKSMIKQRNMHPMAFQLLVHSYTQLGNHREASLVETKLNTLKTNVDYLRTKSYIYSPFGSLVALDSLTTVGPIK